MPISSNSLLIITVVITTAIMGIIINGYVNTNRITTSVKLLINTIWYLIRPHQQLARLQAINHQINQYIINTLRANDAATFKTNWDQLNLKLSSNMGYRLIQHYQPTMDQFSLPIMHNVLQYYHVLKNLMVVNWFIEQSKLDP